VIRLDRASATLPASWDETARGAFPDYAAFRARAEAFEALDVDDPRRRGGFRGYAPEVLPLVGRKKQNDFKAIWGKLKRALAAMSHQKCAYCEYPINAERSAAVEHFRPKALFPTLVYEWENFFLGCGGCNGAKADRWPAGSGCYVRPDEGDPGALFVFHEDGSMEAAAGNESAGATIRDFDLNREWLRNLRRRAIREALAEVEDVMGEAGIPAEVRAKVVERQLGRVEEAGRAYSAAVSQCFRRAWRRERSGG
jgi:uncharacterized protein (TIGR02646 family)